MKHIPMPTKVRHKHADLIHAWADGAEIQQMVPPEKGGLGGWHKFDGNWEKMSDYYIYRLKPAVGVSKLEHTTIKPEEKKPVVRWLWADTAGGQYRETDFFYTEDEISSHPKAIKLEWSRTEFPE